MIVHDLNCSFSVVELISECAVFYPLVSLARGNHVYFGCINGVRMRDTSTGVVSELVSKIGLFCVPFSIFANHVGVYTMYSLDDTRSCRCCVQP